MPNHLFLPPRDQRPIVLVHGAWVGEWSWMPIMSSLRSSARPVHCVSLTGHGTRRHEANPGIVLDDHVRDLVSVYETLDVANSTLVGHSYGGRVISRAFPSLADRIAHMVYLDAHTPVVADPGQTPERIALADKHGGMLPFPDRYMPPPSMLGGPRGSAWFRERLTEHSFATFHGEWQVSLPDALPKTFVYAAGDPASRFSAYAAFCRNSPHWNYREITGHHFLMISHRAETAEIILQAN